MIKILPLLHPNAYAHMCAGFGQRWTNLQVTPMWSVSIFITQAPQHGHRKDIGMRMNFCMDAEITMLGQKIYFFCKRDTLAKSTSPTI